MTRRHLSELEQLTLLSVLRLGDDAWGGAIRDDLAATAGRKVSVATIYVALSRLEQQGLVRSWMSDPLPVRGGKARKLYALESPGIEALRQAKATFERMWADVLGILDGA